MSSGCGCTPITGKDHFDLRAHAQRTARHTQGTQSHVYDAPGVYSADVLLMEDDRKC